MLYIVLYTYTVGIAVTPVQKNLANHEWRIAQYIAKMNYNLSCTVRNI